jgi:hypothetical protein
MKQLYFFDDDLDYVLGGTGKGFVSKTLKCQDSIFYYYDSFVTHRVCKNTHSIEYMNIYTGMYAKERDGIKFYPTKELWEKAKSEYFTKLLSDNEAEKQKILKSMEGV